MEITKKQFREAIKQVYKDGANHGANYHSICKKDMDISINEAFTKLEH